MEAIKYLKDDATVPKVEGNKIIVHICNDIGGWGKGFVLAISKKWPEPEKAYREWYKHRLENDFALGASQIIRVSENIFVGNMIAQRGLKRTNNIAPIRYDAVRTCLNTIASEAKKMKAGIYYGSESFPVNWKEGLVMLNQIEKLASRLEEKWK